MLLLEVLELSGIWGMGRGDAAACPVLAPAPHPQGGTILAVPLGCLEAALLNQGTWRVWKALPKGFHLGTRVCLEPWG